MICGNINSLFQLFVVHVPIAHNFIYLPIPLFHIKSVFFSLLRILSFCYLKFKILDL